MNLMEFDWSLCRTFLSIARHGSLSGASRELGQSHPTVRRQLESLESSIRSPLFTRSPGGLHPTPLGLRLIPLAEAMEASAGALARTASFDDQALAGVVRIAASEFIGVHVLPSILAGIRNAHPGLTFELVLSNRSEDLLRREADVAVRMTQPVQDGLVASRLGSTAVSLHASTGWVERNGAPASVEDLLSRRALIGEDRRSYALAAMNASGIPAKREDFAFMTDTNAAMIAAVRAGLGIGGIQIACAKRWGDLVTILPELRFEMDMWLVTHPDLRHVPQVRVVLDMLREGLKSYLSE